MEDDFAALVEQARQMRAAGDRQGALELFKRAEQTSPSHHGVMLEIASELRDLDRQPEAEAIYDQILAADPAHFGALVGRGHLERRRGNRQAALENFQAAGRVNPNHVGALIEIADELLYLGRNNEARLIFERAFALDADNFHCIVQLAVLTRRAGNRTRSLGLFRKALAAHPAHTGLMLEAAYDLLQLSRLDEAQVMYLRCFDVAPGNVAAMIGLGLVARQRGDRAAALEQFLAAVAVDPAARHAQLELAREFLDAGRYDEARQQIDRVLAQTPEDQQALVLAGHLSRATGDQEAALAAFRRAMVNQPDDPQMLVECALDERIAGNPDKSAALLIRAREIDSFHLPALMQLVEHALLADEPERALELAWEAIDKHPATALPYVQASRSLATLGRPDEALRLLREALSKCSDDVLLATQQIEILRRTGQWAAARSILVGRSDVRQNFDLWVQACKLHLEVGDFEAGARALKSPPGETVQQRATALLLQGELAEALWDFTTARDRLAEAVALHPMNGHLHNVLARYCMVDLDFADAERHLRRAVQLDGSAIRLRGYSSNFTQSHLGQLFNELRIDRDVTARLTALRDQPIEAQLEALLALVAAEPHHTGAALRLLIAVRRSGLFADPTDSEEAVSGSAIPRQIAQFWNQGIPPPDVLACMESWQRQNPSFGYRVFDEATACAFIRESYDSWTERAFIRSREPAQRADLFRLAWLYENGGVYADADDLCLAPIARLLVGGRTMIAYQEEYGTLGNNFLAATRRHPVIGEALRLAVAAVNRRDSETIWLKTGPALLTRVFAASMAETNLHLRRWLSETTVMERHRLRSFSLPQIGLTYKRTGHHWMHNIQARTRAHGQQRQADKWNSA
jgi:tetratricopeptide (TPR) repeat protein